MASKRSKKRRRSNRGPRVRIGRVLSCLGIVVLMGVGGYFALRKVLSVGTPARKSNAPKPGLSQPPPNTQLGWYPMLSEDEIKDMGQAGINDLEPDLKEKKLYIRLPDNKRLRTGIDLCIQKLAFDIFKENGVLWGTLVAMDSRTGTIKALVTYSRAAGKDQAWYNILDPFPRASHYPAASLVKLTTGAVALANNLWDPNKLVDCKNTLKFGEGQYVTDAYNTFHGTVNMAQALATSCNYTFGLIAQAVGQKRLLAGFENFGYGRPIPLDLEVQTDSFEVGESDFEVARAGTGFGNITLSPVHGALIAAALARDGTVPRPHIGTDLQKGPITLSVFHPGRDFAIMDAQTSGKLRDMMVLTAHWRDPAGGSRKGTAFNAFYDEQGKPLIPGRKFAAKTGSLRGDNPPGSYYWLIGFPVEPDPIVFSILVINEGRGKIRAASAFGEILRRLSQGRCPPPAR